MEDIRAQCNALRTQLKREGQRDYYSLNDNRWYSLKKWKPHVHGKRVSGQSGIITKLAGHTVEPVGPSNYKSPCLAAKRYGLTCSLKSQGHGSEPMLQGVKNHDGHYVWEHILLQGHSPSRYAGSFCASDCPALCAGCHRRFLNADRWNGHLTKAREVITKAAESAVNSESTSDQNPDEESSPEDPAVVIAKRCWHRNAVYNHLVRSNSWKWVKDRVASTGRSGVNRGDASSTSVSAAQQSTDDNLVQQPFHAVTDRAEMKQYRKEAQELGMTDTLTGFKGVRWDQLSQIIIQSQKLANFLDARKQKEKRLKQKGKKWDDGALDGFETDPDEAVLEFKDVYPEMIYKGDSNERQ